MKLLKTGESKIIFKIGAIEGGISFIQGCCYAIGYLGTIIILNKIINSKSKKSKKVNNETEEEVVIDAEFTSK